MNLQSFFRDFNPSKFVVHCSLLGFIILFALRLDGGIDWPYWAIFMPLWIWKGIAILGAAVGAVVWCRYPHYRLEGDSYTQFKAMLISLSLHLILLMFELLACDKLSSGRHLWVLVFIPLIFGSVASVGACVWAVKHDRSFELELFLAVNALQFVSLPLKLDQFVNWNWEVVFVPMWIVICLSLVSVLYNVIFCGIMMRAPEISLQQKRAALNAAVGNICTVLPLLCFQVVICDKLEGELKFPYMIVFSPLMISLSALIGLSFSAKGGNKWWFGIRKSFHQFLLSAMPFLQEYGNISYHVDRSAAAQSVPLDASTSNVHTGDFDKHDKKSKKGAKNDSMKPVMPIISIDMPD
ncbi:transmembrane protein 185B [Zeugodacus cucurbitae]|uniref:transmembrane protein 185B n=1 Tax=Zeugodacus cucurbitae TaxID=28588 RepID=UPI000596A90B|nr:transmembrane protein 185B [Zeugodacus cucurbitae]XP_028900020.1 transmembrane protein 185B [Zeugodacus cucurbitae]